MILGHQKHIDLLERKHFSWHPQDRRRRTLVSKFILNLSGNDLVTWKQSFERIWLEMCDCVRKENKITPISKTQATTTEVSCTHIVTLKCVFHKNQKMSWLVGKHRLWSFLQWWSSTKVNKLVYFIGELAGFLKPQICTIKWLSFYKTNSF